MKMIDRYVYAVTEHLSENTREDVSQELRANIEDMLPDDPTESDVRIVLEKLGNPTILANEYSQKKRYLIGPALYDNYFTVLKLVICIVTIVFLCITLLKWALNPPFDGNFSQVSIQFFTDMIVIPFQGIVQGFLWVTIVFAILERTGVTEGRLPFGKKKWSPDDLPDVPASSKRKISRIETIFSMFCTVFSTALLYYQSDLIGLYIKGDSGFTHVVPLFAHGRLKSYIIIILLFAMVQFCIFIWKFIAMKWTLPLAIANTINNIALSIFICVILSDTSLFNQEILSKFADITNTSLTLITSIWLRTLWISAVIIIGISLIDSVMGFRKCKK